MNTRTFTLPSSDAAHRFMRACDRLGVKANFPTPVMGDASPVREVTVILVKSDDELVAEALFDSACAIAAKKAAA